MVTGRPGLCCGGGSVVCVPAAHSTTKRKTLHSVHQSSDSNSLQPFPATPGKQTELETCNQYQRVAKLTDIQGSIVEALWCCGNICFLPQTCRGSLYSRTFQRRAHPGMFCADGPWESMRGPVKLLWLPLTEVLPQPVC